MNVLTGGLRERGRLLIVLALSAAIGTALVLGRGATATEAAPETPKSFVILIGDGMGPAQRTATQLAKYGYDKTQPMDALDYGGALRTHSLAPITDSAASATAMATGEKTHNDFAGVDPKGNPLELLLESAKDRGKATGLVSDHDITNATMAGFGAHVKNRDHKKEIARQFAYETQPDVMFGGREKLWYRPGDKDMIPDIFDDDANNGRENLVKKLMDDGYEYAYDRKTVAGLSGPKAIGLVQDDSYFIHHEVKGYSQKKDPHAVPEEDLVAKALELLGQNPNGFFLAIEVDELDDAGHEHDGRSSIQMGQLVNRITKKVEKYRETDPDVLFVVTADHETGGMTVEGKNMKSGNSGPDGNVPDYGTPQNVPLGKGLTPKRWGPFKIAGSSDQFKVDWTTPGHTGQMVPLTASGPSAERLSGIHDNTYIHEVALDVLNEGP
ncbi:MAG: alkaline phosphatase [Solirubrobacterales bacterium]